MAGLTSKARAIRPRRARNHALLQEDPEPRAAERALRDILTLAPFNAEARHNLCVLLARSASTIAGHVPSDVDKMRWPRRLPLRPAIPRATLGGRSPCPASTIPR
ncbi:MAG: hypothetical protein ACYC61_24105 [Isosphaeraceae bacterium]